MFLPDPGERRTALEADDSLTELYLQRLQSIVPEPRRFEGLRVLLDCANGSASGIAPEVFRHHGAEVETTGAAPDGRNINLGGNRDLLLNALGWLAREEGLIQIRGRDPLSQPVILSDDARTVLLLGSIGGWPLVVGSLATVFMLLRRREKDPAR